MLHIAKQEKSLNLVQLKKNSQKELRPLLLQKPGRKALIKMRKLIVLSISLLLSDISHAQRSDTWAKKLCTEQPDKYSCTKLIFARGVKNTSWEHVFGQDASLLKTINRRNTAIWKGHTIAVPHDKPLKELNYYSPFSGSSYRKERHIIIDLNQLAWAAYQDGNLIRWGAANGGIKRCKETGKLTCKTHPGEWTILEKAKRRTTKSGLYPVECSNKKKCGFPMYWYTRFHMDGTGLHGARNLLGANLGHGCVRLMEQDSKWIHSFVEVGTRIKIENY